MIDIIFILFMFLDDYNVSHIWIQLVLNLLQHAKQLTHLLFPQLYRVLAPVLTGQSDLYFRIALVGAEIQLFPYILVAPEQT